MQRWEFGDGGRDLLGTRRIKSIHWPSLNKASWRLARLELQEFRLIGSCTFSYKVTEIAKIISTDSYGPPREARRLTPCWPPGLIYPCNWMLREMRQKLFGELRLSVFFTWLEGMPRKTHHGIFSRIGLKDHHNAWPFRRLFSSYFMSQKPFTFTGTIYTYSGKLFFER